MLLLLAGAGLTMDQMLSFIGFFDFGRLLLPAWIVVLWLLFSSALLHCLKPVMRNPLVASFLGLVAGPASYYVGVKLGAASFGLPLSLVLVVLGVLWALYMYVAACLVNWIPENDAHTELATGKVG